MGQAKQIIILICFLMLGTVSGWCIEEKLEQGFPADINNKLEKLQIYFETEMYEEASTLLDELITQFPNEPRFEYLQAIVDYQRQEYERAQEVLVKFIEEYPDVAEPYYLLGEINLKQGNQDLARQYLTRYCGLVPQDIDAQHKLSSISSENSGGIIIIKDGKEDLALVGKIGFYGGCVHAQQKQSIKLINGIFCSWSSMGIDFTYPIDLRGKQIVLKLKGKQGGERFQLTLRDKFAPDYNPQLILEPEEESICRYWKKQKVSFAEQQSKIDLSQIVHMGLEFGSSTVQNPAHSTLFVKDIIINEAQTYGTK